MHMIRYECKGGPLSGQTICVAEGVTRYKTRTMVNVMGEIVPTFQFYELNDEGVFVHTGSKLR
jgi:hypothetical protein